MLKAVKECLRNWLKTHERLYWYIVVGLAVLAFGIITAVGCAKLERAEAATATGETSITVTWHDELQTMDLLDWQYYFIAEGGSHGGGACVVYSNAPLVRSSNGMMKASDGSKIGTFGMTDKPLIWETYSGLVSSISSGDSFTSFRANHDIYNEDGTLWLANSVISEMYSPDAPYTTFQNVVVDNKIRDGASLKVFSNFYDDYTKTSTWKYFGRLNNMVPDADLSYKAETVFLVHIPTADYVEGLFASNDIDIEWEHNVLKYGGSLIHQWNMDKKAPYREYEFTYVIDIVPDSEGNYTYNFTFADIENLVKYWNPDFLTEFNGYSEYFRSIMMSFVHVECVTSAVTTTREGQILYGKVTTNQFSRGVYHSCVEVIPDIDINTATPEEIDKIIADAEQEAHDKYIADLENRVEDLENQMGNVGTVNGAFGSLENTDLWTGFQNLVAGLASFGPAIGSLSSLTGAVFAFLPVTITGIMSTTLFAICVIAIIKAIRG